MATAHTRLIAIKLAHTVVWALFAGCVIGMPLATFLGHHRAALGLAAAVFVEVLILAFNRWRCPLTGVAAHYTDDRRDNFDIYLPLWLAKNNKLIFGTLYVVGLIYTGAAWMLAQTE
ncbi:hypothetical protein E4T66_20860 [Sinimarinibacterium sp. CAU 1509]|uniref:hypothetical protein n=1 Tax=Sinimarinibacterium sp. CAU 1509 TaxID=2562283 RepID=UPI0010AB6D27|nr:hypothetical protein [Sinimarinibacterium sp. CAU 1509]TJY55563.1 hypothetical protein E4T66_20860 [Sinimarinibacterium sp. CAU 1509]